MNLQFQQNRHRFASKPENYCPIGKRIYEDMQSLNISSKSLAKAIGLKGPSYISHILRGDFPNSPIIPDIQKYLEMQKREFEEKEVK